MTHLNLQQLEDGLDEILQSPKDEGVVELIVRRPVDDEREVLQEAELDLAVGMVGDNWKDRVSRHTADGSANPEQQLTLMNSRTISLLAQDKDRWSLAGDQFFVDFDLTAVNLPAGTQLSLGTAIVEVTAVPHLGCHKFSERFGSDATRFVNSTQGKELNLRGVNAKVVQAGGVVVGDVVRKV